MRARARTRLRLIVQELIEHLIDSGAGRLEQLCDLRSHAESSQLSWRLSNTLDASFCVEALHEALERYGPPEIFNSDQGSQFTSVDFTDVLKEAGIRISMDGKGRWMDNVFIERLWRSLKYECVYLSEFAKRVKITLCDGPGGLDPP